MRLKYIAVEENVISYKGYELQPKCYGGLSYSIYKISDGSFQEDGLTLEKAFDWVNNNKD